MRVGIDISSVVFGRGVSRYTTNLTQSLIELGVPVSLYGSSLRQRKALEDFCQKMKQKSKSTQSKLTPYPPAVLSRLWKYLQWPSLDSLLPDADVFHSWDWLQPPSKNIPVVSTVHDVAILKFPQTAHPKILQMHQDSWKILKEKQSHIIAVSRTTKNDLVNFLNYPQYLIHVVHEAIPREVANVSMNMTEERYELLKNSLGRQKPFLLFVGTREPRKNLDRLIEAWQPLHGDVDLLIVGSEGWGESQNINGPKPEYLGRVSDEFLSVLYAEASVFTYPSLYEGFGLPILESFFHGTPVLTSENSGMREVAGNAAELIDPESVESIRNGIIKLLSEDVQEQSKRLQRMMIRLQMFTWEKVALETLAVYKQVVQEHNE
ncbi:MAG: glycosyltransferase family 1 protein [Microgenomates group bacterium]